MAERQEHRQLTPEEIEESAGEQLPSGRCRCSANVAIPVDAAVTADVLSDGVVTYTDAAPDTPVDER